MLPVKILKLVPVKKPKLIFFFFFAIKHIEAVTCFFHSFLSLKDRMSTLPAPSTSFLPLVQGRSLLCCPDLCSHPQSVFSTSSLLTTPPPTSLYQDVQMSRYGSPVSFRLTSTPAQPPLSFVLLWTVLVVNLITSPGLQQHLVECSRVWWLSVCCRWAV